MKVRLSFATQLRQSLLRKTFQGKLVPQDPNDEPASVLLERIRAERAATVATKNGNYPNTSKFVAEPARRRRAKRLAQRASVGYKARKGWETITNFQRAP